MNMAIVSKTERVISVLQSTGWLEKLERFFLLSDGLGRGRAVLLSPRAGLKTVTGTLLHHHSGSSDIDLEGSQHASALEGTRGCGVCLWYSLKGPT